MCVYTPTLQNRAVGQRGQSLFIFHLSFFIFHRRIDQIIELLHLFKWKISNDKWKMTNDYPFPTA